MQLKILYTAALILSMSMLASSHDCSWPGMHKPCKGSAKACSRPTGARGSAGAAGSAQSAAEKEEAVDFSLVRILFV